MRKNKTEIEFHRYLFHEGTNSHSYEFMGVHFERVDGQSGAVFRVWAPNAKKVSVIGDFNGWDREESPMFKISKGVWECFVPSVKQYDCYKFSMYTQRGTWIDKSDPFAFHSETRPFNASKVYDVTGYEWGDDSWMLYREKTGIYDKPLNIYELHAGSWRKTPSGDFLTYRQLADELIPYVKDMGYTHIELMPISEYPLDASWGYQCTGYFAATSRYGTPHDLMWFIDMCHRAGVGVVLDWVPAHFPKDGFSLSEFDGGYCYEYPDPLMMEHAEWGTRIFNFGRSEVCSFLLSSAMFWLDVYHADGLRVDAVASMLYLDYGRQSGRWRPNKYGGNQNLDSVEFLKRLNQLVFAEKHNVLMIAEESTAWPLVTKPVDIGGLGFNLKWNMGWMNDIMHYFKLDPYFRQFNHKDITFSFFYAFSENYVLPISHDEVVHMKGSLFSKMPGEYDAKVAGVRSFLSYMMAHPGKKMLFMGSELGQVSEWNFETQLDWFLLNEEPNKKLNDFIKALNFFYLGHKELWECDFDWTGFEWICSDDNQGNTVIFKRIAKNGNYLIFAVNFSTVFRDKYCIGVNEPGYYSEIFNSDAVEFGGEGRLNTGFIKSSDKPCHDKEHSIEVDVPPLSAVFLKFARKIPGRRKKTDAVAKLKKNIAPDKKAKL